MKNTILYLGGFQLPDKNAAAQRVIGVAKGLRELGYEVIFLNSLKGCHETKGVEKLYFGFKCFEYGREGICDYLLSGKTSLAMIAQIKPSAVIAYNYPAAALNRIRKYCLKKGIRCYVDATEWYQPKGNLLFRVIKTIDTEWRMQYVQKKVDGVIAISDYLYRYYSPVVKTVKIPATVDIAEDKWNVDVQRKTNKTTFVYAGSPSAQKEKLDDIVSAIENVSLEKRVELKVIGITKELYEKMYHTHYYGNVVSFLGRIPHEEVIEHIKAADWSVVIREDNKVVRAGFPTKVAESISCGTPVVANRFSNIYDYLTEENSICVEDMADLPLYIRRACDRKCAVDNSVFDYRHFLKELKVLI